MRYGPFDNSIRELQITAGDGVTISGPLSDYHGVLTGIAQPTGGSDVFEHSDDSSR